MDTKNYPGTPAENPTRFFFQNNYFWENIRNKLSLRKNIKLNNVIMKGLQIDIHESIMNCVTPRGHICAFVEIDNIAIVGKDTENGVELDWGKIELSVGDKVKITAIEGMEYDTIYASNITDEELLRRYNQLKFFLTKEGVLK